MSQSMDAARNSAQKDDTAPCTPARRSGQQLTYHYVPMSFRRSRKPSASADLEESGTSTIESSVESHVRSTVQRLLGKCERKFFHVKTFAVELWKPEFSERRDCSGTVLPHRSLVCRQCVGAQNGSCFTQFQLGTGPSSPTEMMLKRSMLDCRA